MIGRELGDISRVGGRTDGCIANIDRTCPVRVPSLGRLSFYRNLLLGHTRLNYYYVAALLGTIWRVFWGLKTDFGSNQIGEQLLFSMLPSILTFNFDLILGPFLDFWGPSELMLGLG